MSDWEIGLGGGGGEVTELIDPTWERVFVEDEQDGPTTVNLRYGAAEKPLVEKIRVEVYNSQHNRTEEYTGVIINDGEYEFNTGEDSVTFEGSDQEIYIYEFDEPVLQIDRVDADMDERFHLWIDFYTSTDHKHS